MVADSSSDYRFRYHPEECGPDDVWGQVKRTVNGKPVPPEQIEMIVEAIASGLELTEDDVLLDLCCGNGALTTRIFQRCKGGLGVDYSPFLIEIASRRFSGRHSEKYLLSDALLYLETAHEPEQFTKVLCYGAFPYFADGPARRILELIHRRFCRTAHLFLGQIPDKTRMHAFYGQHTPEPGEENRAGSLLGIWRTPLELTMMAQLHGWHARCENMPAQFYASHYRFDGVLTRM